MAETTTKAPVQPYAVGTTGVLESTPVGTDGGDRWSHSAGKWSVERKQLSGAAHAIALVKASVIGSSYSEDSPNLKLVECSAAPREGGVMEVTTIWETPDDALNASDSSDEEELIEVQELWELQWQDINKPLQQAPCMVEVLTKTEEYNAASGSQGTYLECIERIKESPAERQKNYQWRNPTKDDLPDSDEAKWMTFSGAVPDEVKKYFEKYWLGIDSFLDCYPVVTHTQVFLEAPVLPGNAGEIVSCPWTSAPAGYQWRYKPLLSCDVASGRWTLREEYTGALSWDEDLYTHKQAAAEGEGDGD